MGEFRCHAAEERGDEQRGGNNAGAVLRRLIQQPCRIGRFQQAAPRDRITVPAIGPEAAAVAGDGESLPSASGRCSLSVMVQRYAKGELAQVVN